MSVEMEYDLLLSIEGIITYGYLRRIVKDKIGTGYDVDLDVFLKERDHRITFVSEKPLVREISVPVYYGPAKGYKDLNLSELLGDE